MIRLFESVVKLITKLIPSKTPTKRNLPAVDHNAAARRGTAEGAERNRVSVKLENDLKLLETLYNALPQPATAFQLQQAAERNGRFIGLQVCNMFLIKKGGCQ